MSPLDSIQRALQPLRDRIVAHPVYSRIDSTEGLRRFMEHHVFAVWDFMTLLKALQRSLTCVELPWRPTSDPLSRRLVNEIVVAEESDEDGRGGVSSHFELYLDAMRQAGAEVGPILGVLDRLDRGASLDHALSSPDVPPAAAEFVQVTWSIASGPSLPAIASAFTLGREELIPDLFRSVIAKLKADGDGSLDLFDYYLDRHIGLDEDEHSPMALRMLASVCGDDPHAWSIAEAAAYRALQARLALWDGVLLAIESDLPSAPLVTSGARP